MPVSEIYHGDCMEYMRTIPDKYFDLCIADPPYGIDAAKMTMGSGKNKQWGKKEWDASIPHYDVFSEMLRVAKHAIIWGGNYFGCLPPTNAWLIWDKGFDGRLSFSDGEMAWTNLATPLRIKRIIRQNTLDYDSIRIHPTQKPVALYAWLIDNYAIGGGVRFSTRSLVVGHRASRRTRRGLTSTGASWTMTTTKRRRNAFSVSATAS